ncbi:MAG: oligosaccharide flippase family protein [Candidatus Aceula meridiana]|nr:oligosaccharide flippase family protein [Candidatus Aceula meridiana]
MRYIFTLALKVKKTFLSLSNLLKIPFRKQKSEILKRSLRNSSFSMFEYTVTPLLYIFSTPFFIYYLGLNHYGIWMLANSVAGLLGVMNFGIGEATVKYVSMYRGREDKNGVVKVIASTFIFSLLFSFVIPIACWFIAPLLVRDILKIAPEDFVMATAAIRIASVVYGIRMIQSVFVAALRGFERYDITSLINIFTLIITTVSSLLLVFLGYGIDILLLSTAGILFLSLIVSIVIVARVTPSLIRPLALDIKSIKEILSFGFFSWIQGIAAALFSQMDRLIIGAFLGTVAVSYYSVASNIARQVHGGVGAATSFLFPLVSSEKEKKNGIILKKLFKRALVFSFVFSFLILISFFLWGRIFLTAWMGASFASNAYVLTLLLLGVYFLLAINVIPHYFLLGFGEVRFVAFTNIMGGVVSTGGIFLLIPALGINGVAIAKFLYVPFVFLNFLKLRRKL